MKPCDLKAEDIAFFSRKITETAEYAGLSDLEKQECEDALAAAKAFAGAYAGIDVATTEFEDVTYAIKVAAAEMIDNHQISSKYSCQNPLVMQILDMHSTNLLPSAEE